MAAANCCRAAETELCDLAPRSWEFSWATGSFQQSGLFGGIAILRLIVFLSFWGLFWAPLFLETPIQGSATFKNDKLGSKWVLGTLRHQGTLVAAVMRGVLLVTETLPDLQISLASKFLRQPSADGGGGEFG